MNNDDCWQIVKIAGEWQILVESSEDWLGIVKVDREIVKASFEIVKICW